MSFIGEASQAGESDDGRRSGPVDRLDLRLFQANYRQELFWGENLPQFYSQFLRQSRIQIPNSIKLFTNIVRLEGLNVRLKAGGLQRGIHFKLFLELKEVCPRPSSKAIRFY